MHRTAPSPGAIALVATLASSLVLAQGSWNRRVYYDDLTCKGHYTHGYQVYIPTAICQDPNKKVNDACETKSRNELTPSSEGTWCQSIQASAVSDAPYFPPEDSRTRRVGDKFIVLNEYAGPSCSHENGKVQIEQVTYLADSKCYAWEPGSYFKASCSGSESTIEFCNDPACNDCIPARRQTFDGTCKPNDRGLQVKASCVVDDNSGSSTSGGASNGTSTNPPGSSSSPKASSKNSASSLFSSSTLLEAALAGLIAFLI